MKRRFFTVCLMVVLTCCVTGCNSTSDGTEKQDDMNAEAGNDDLNLENSTSDVADDDEGTLQFDVPEGFTYDEKSTLYISQDGLANINYIAKENDGSFPMMTQMLVEMGIESSLSTQLGTEVDITIVSWEETEVDGYEALRYSITYTVEEIYIEQTQFVVNGTKKLHSLTFTEMENADYENDFTVCEQTLRFE